MMSMPLKRNRASTFTSRKGKLVYYLLHVTQDDGDKNYLCQLQCDIEESIEYILRIWLLYVSIKILLTFCQPHFFFLVIKEFPFFFQQNDLWTLLPTV